MRGSIAAMETLQVGDWVQTKAGHEGTILLISRLSAFVDIEGHDEMRTRPYLLSELTKVKPPTKPNKEFPGP
jgi:hypothetical protein